MAEDQGKAGPSKNLEDILDDSFEFTSETFDPVRLIYSGNLDTVDRNVEVYDSVSQFFTNIQQIPSQQVSAAEVSVAENKSTVCVNDSIKSEMPPSEIDSVDKKSADSAMEETVSMTDSIPASSQSHSVDPAPMLADLHQKDETTKQELSMHTSVPGKRTESLTRRKTRRTVLLQMEDGFQYGPLSVLRRCVQEKLKVRVWTRSVRNIRGICTGCVVAFDKHMNLAMVDVDEVYRKPVGKHQRKSKKPVVKAPPPPDVGEAEALYPNTSWQPVSASSISTHHTPSVGGAENTDLDSESDDESCRQDVPPVPADGIGNLNSAFKGMHVFEETEATRLLGVKSKKVLTRHLNQVLLRGEHVVAIALVDLVS